MRGDAYKWNEQADAKGILVDNNPTVGSIAQTDIPAGLGHVAVVESVNGDGTITVSESSYSTSQISIKNFLWRHRTISPSEFQTFIHVPIRGDLNGDGTVNSIDWSIMNTAWGTADPTADINGDGIVNSIDWSIMNENWGAP
jgi:surface antigen